jgi:hypothetical protein
MHEDRASRRDVTAVAKVGGRQVSVRIDLRIVGLVGLVERHRTVVDPVSQSWWRSIG